MAGAGGAMKAAIRIASVYLLVSIVWVSASDWVFAALFPADFPTISLYKGWIFVALTSILIYVLLRGEGEKRDLVEGELRALAVYYSLTGLLIRACFIENLEKAIALAAREDGHVGVVFLDLDGFKEVNDNHGHHVGDELLVEVGKRLDEVIRSSDSAARFGGDEFVILVRNDREGTERLANRLVDAMRRPFDLHGAEVTVTASVGYALYPEHGEQGGQLIRAADMAMYRVKESGKNAIMEATVV